MSSLHIELRSSSERWGLHAVKCAENPLNPSQHQRWLSTSCNKTTWLCEKTILFCDILGMYSITLVSETQFRNQTENFHSLNYAAPHNSMNRSACIEIYSLILAQGTWDVWASWQYMQYCVILRDLIQMSGKIIQTICYMSFNGPNCISLSQVKEIPTDCDHSGHPLTVTRVKVNLLSLSTPNCMKWLTMTKMNEKWKELHFPR